MHRARALTAIALVLVASPGCSRMRWKKSPPKRASAPLHVPATRPPAVAPLYSAPTSTATASAPPTPSTPATTFGPPPPPGPCTDRFGHALTTSFGRLDGTIVALVPPAPPRTARCKSDEHHLHLQLEVDTETYDVAVPLGDPAVEDMYFLETTALVPGGRWRGGWAPGQRLDYVGAFRVHAEDFRPLSRDELLQKLQMDLSVKRHVSVWATGYGPGGAHMVHRDRGQHDGTIALDPDSARSRFLLFRFARQRF
jgi:hypothetical protein